MKRYRSLAFIYHKPGDMRLQELELSCGPTDVLIKVRACARCGTDKNIFLQGHPKVDPHAPLVLGHELVGEIAEVGSQVASLKKGIGYREGQILSPQYLDFQPGERVVVQSRIARYQDGLMLINKPLTILSFYINGGYSQYMLCPKELIQSGSLLRLPLNVSDEEATLVEPAACVLESIYATPHPIGIDEEGRHLYRAGIKRGGCCCIIGSGTMGMIYALFCQLEGASEIFMIVRSQEKAQLLRKVLGHKVEVSTVINPPYSHQPLAQKEQIEAKLVEELKLRTGGELFNDVIVTCSDPDAQRLMLKLYAPAGYAVGACFGGAHQKVDAADLDQNHYCGAKTIGTSGCSTKAMETIISWLGEKRISLRSFVASQRYTFETPPEEFFTTNAGGLKPVLYPWG